MNTIAPFIIGKGPIFGPKSGIGKSLVIDVLICFIHVSYCNYRFERMTMTGTFDPRLAIEALRILTRVDQGGTLISSGKTMQSD